MDGQIEEALKERRNQDLLAMCNEIIIRKNAALVGSIVNVRISESSGFTLYGEIID